MSRKGQSSDPGERPATRRAILDLLKRQGALTAGALAEALDVTDMAARLHLYELADEGLVSFTEERGGRGRPTKFWRLTEAAAGLFPDSHRELAIDLIQTVRATLGEEAFAQILERRGEEQVQLYRAAFAPDASIAARLAVLAARRTAEGYMAQVQEGGPGEWWLIENHCPICAAARTCTRLCTNELQVFQGVLGADVIVERTDHIVSGANRCAYRVTEKS